MTDTRQADKVQQVALVSGAAGSIGQAVAHRLLSDGYLVVLSDLNAGDPAAAGSWWITTDVTSAAEVENLFEKTIQRHGRIDVVVPVAGIVSLGPISQITVDEWDKVQAVNLRGTFLMVQQALKVMKQQRSGRIVTIGSVLAKNGGNPRPWIDPEAAQNASNAAYGASKAGVHALTLFAAKEAASYGVSVNCVAPGPIASEMTTKLPASLIEAIPLGRMGRADEVADAVAYLISERASFITGEILDINGGLYID